jgi:hypothetical protein
MSAAQKDLSYYLQHTDEMPTDPKEIEALANAHIAAALESGADQVSVDRFVEPDDKAASSPADTKVETEAKPAAETKPADDAKPAAEVKPAEEAKPAAEAKPEGILAKDGKNVIPYSQLESARERAKAAEELARDQAAELERLKAEKTAGQVTAATNVSQLTEEELKALEGDSPTLAKVLRAQQQTIQQLSGAVQTLTERQQNQFEQEVVEVKDEIQKAIDAVPTLAEWQTAEDQSMWKKAASFDRVLRELPEYKDVAFEDRFKKVVELTQSALGLESETPPVNEETPVRQAPTQEEIKAAAAAKLKAKPSLPRSLSDIPGGSPPVADERERVEGMSSTELGGKFLSMTREQLDAYLSNL